MVNPEIVKPGFIYAYTMKKRNKNGLSEENTHLKNIRNIRKDLLNKYQKIVKLSN